MSGKARGLSAERAAELRRKLLGVATPGYERHVEEAEREAPDRSGRGHASGVGYRRPPSASRFKPGQSGNPNGRPKAPPRMDQVGADFLAAAGRTVTVRRAEGPEEITVGAALVEKTIEAGIKGNAHAQRTALNELHRAKAAEAARISEEIKLWTEYQEIERRLIAEAEQRGEEEPLSVPHPDDIVIDEETGVSFIGPTNVKELAVCETRWLWRDACLLQDAQDRRLGAVPRYPRSFDEFSHAIVMAVDFDRTLPPRLQLADKLKVRSGELDRMPKRRLLKETRAAWKELGVDRARGEAMPTMGEIAPVQKLMSEAFKVVDLDTTTSEELTARLAGMIRKFRDRARGRDDDSGREGLG